MASKGKRPVGYLRWSCRCHSEVTHRMEAHQGKTMNEVLNSQEFGMFLKTMSQSIWENSGWLLGKITTQVILKE